MIYENLKNLCDYYSQDFESIGQTNTSPIDWFCYEYDLGHQKQLLVEMESFLKEVDEGTKDAEDLDGMGLEYNQSLGGSWDWFREAMEYLRKKTAES